MTKDEVSQIINDVCPHCLAGKPLKYRGDTKEWTHEVVRDLLGMSRTVTTCLCLATHFRNKHESILNG